MHWKDERVYVLDPYFTMGDHLSIHADHVYHHFKARVNSDPYIDEGSTSLVPSCYIPCWHGRRCHLITSSGMKLVRKESHSFGNSEMELKYHILAPVFDDIFEIGFVMNAQFIMRSSGQHFKPQ